MLSINLRKSTIIIQNYANIQKFHAIATNVHKWSLPKGKLKHFYIKTLISLTKYIENSGEKVDFRLSLYFFKSNISIWAGWEDFQAIF